MKSALPWLGALLATALFSNLAPAQYPMYGPPMQYPGSGPFGLVAPDMCGQGYYSADQCGNVYGPNYCVRPPFPPYNGPRPQMKKGGGGAPTIPTHPFARSPRDFFMLD